MLGNIFSMAIFWGLNPFNADICSKMQRSDFTLCIQVS